jgi:hypothetical protein
MEIRCLTSVCVFLAPVYIFSSLSSLKSSFLSVTLVEQGSSHEDLLLGVKFGIY